MKKHTAKQNENGVGIVPKKTITLDSAEYAANKKKQRAISDSMFTAYNQLVDTVIKVKKQRDSLQKLAVKNPTADTVKTKNPTSQVAVKASKDSLTLKIEAVLKENGLLGKSHLKKKPVGRCCLTNTQTNNGNDPNFPNGNFFKKN